MTHKGRSRSRRRDQIPEKRSAILFFHKSFTDKSKMSFYGFLGVLILFLDLEIKSEVILTHKGRSRSRRRGQIPEKRSAVLFFSQKHHRYVQDVVLGVFGDADSISGLRNSIRGHPDP